jgi:hypothetical protein
MLDQFVIGAAQGAGNAERVALDDRCRRGSERSLRVAAGLQSKETLAIFL